MTNRRIWLGLIAILAAVALLLWYDRPGAAPPAGAPAGKAPSGQDSETGSAPGQTAAAPGARDTLVDSLQAALGSHNREAIRAAANAVRQKALEDDAYVRMLGETLLDEGRPGELREVIALILGTIGERGAEKMLVGALGKVRDPGIRRCLIYALGSWKEPEDTDSFGGLENPWVVEHASGLQIVVKTKITDPEVQKALLGLMNPAQDAETRADAARSLRHSLDEEAVRKEFLQDIAQERDPDMVAELGSALGDWAVQLPEGRENEREKIVDLLIDFSQKPDQEALRVKSQEAILTLPLSSSEISATQKVYQKSADPDVKHWALSLLNRQAGRLTETELSQVKAIYLNTLGGDSNGKLRELAAQGLSNLRDDPAATQALLKTAQQDAEWNVRDAAVEALGRQAGSPAAVAALEKIAAEDPNEIVRQTAQTALQKIKSKAGER